MQERTVQLKSFKYDFLLSFYILICGQQNNNYDAAVVSDSIHIVFMSS